MNLVELMVLFMLNSKQSHGPTGAITLENTYLLATRLIFVLGPTKKLCYRMSDKYFNFISLIFIDILR